MPWTAPRTWVTGEVVTAAIMNSHVRDNLLALQPVAARDMTAGTTTSAAYGDLTGTSVGPAVSVATGAAVTVIFTAQYSSSATPGGTTYGGVCVVVSGATTVAASDDNGVLLPVAGINQPTRLGGVIRLTGLTTGTNTFTLKYRTNGGGTGSFSRRELTVIAA